MTAKGKDARLERITTAILAGLVSRGPTADDETIEDRVSTAVDYAVALIATLDAE